MITLAFILGLLIGTVSGWLLRTTTDDGTTFSYITTDDGPTFDVNP